MTEARLIGVLALLAALVFGVGLLQKRERDAGAAQCRAEVAEATAAAILEDRKLQERASAAYQATRAAAAARLPEARHAISDALAAPMQCNADRLADVVVPRSVLRGLRAAGGGQEPASAAAR